MTLFTSKQAKDAVEIIVLIIVIVVVIQHFFVQPIVIRDDSMSPEYSEGDVILIKRIWNRERVLKRDSIVALRSYNRNPYKTLRKIVGLPRERVVLSDGILTIFSNTFEQRQLPLFGSAITSLNDVGNIDPSEYFVMTNSSIKEPVGLIDARHIIGVPIIRIWPLKE